MPRMVPTSSFDTEPDILGRPRRQVITATLLSLPLIYIFYIYLGGIWFILASAAVIWYVFLPIAEYFLEVVPPKVINHSIEWFRAGTTLYITNDTKPTPLSVPDQRNQPANRPR